jgi:DNA-binding NarL/FixJ family response regulator
MTTPPWPSLKILLLEDDPLDAELIVGALHRTAPGWKVQRVATRAAFTQALASLEPNVVLSDHAVSSFDAFDALQLTRTRRPGIPFVLVAGMFEETTARCLRSGADNFVNKSDLSRLSPAIVAAVAVREPLLKLSERQLQVLQLIALGCSTRETARRMQLSVKTVETHRAEVMKRLEIHDVAGLVRFAIRVGLIAVNQ